MQLFELFTKTGDPSDIEIFKLVPTVSSFVHGKFTLLYTPFSSKNPVWIDLPKLNPFKMLVLAASKPLNRMKGPGQTLQ